MLAVLFAEQQLVRGPLPRGGCRYSPGCSTTAGVRGLDAEKEGQCSHLNKALLAALHCLLHRATISLAAVFERLSRGAHRQVAMLSNMC